VPPLYRKAIELQPGNLATYVALANALDNQQRPLAALEALQPMREVGRAAEAECLIQEGFLLMRWGLRAQAIERFEQLSKLGFRPHHGLRLLLGRAFAGLGRKARARAILAEIPEYAPQYVPAQILVSDLPDTDDGKLAAVRDLAKRRPGDARVLAKEMAVLTAADRPAEAVQAFNAFLRRGGDQAPAPVEAGALALRAAARAGDLPEAVRISRTVAQSTRSLGLKLTAAAILMETDPSLAAGLMPDVDKSDLLAAALGLCLAQQTGDREAAKQWGDRIERIDERLGKLQPSRSIPPAYRLLCALLLEDQLQVKVALKKLSEVWASQCAAELASRNTRSKQAKKEVLKLLRATIVRDLGQPELCRAWAIEQLKAQPTCQWAALATLQASRGAAQLQELLDLLEPKDCDLAKMIRASMLEAEGQLKAAAKVYGDLARARQDDPELLLRQAMAIERAGDFAEAVELYRRVWQQSENPVAANNAAYLVTQLWPDDKTRLTEAQKWMEKAISAVPTASFYDTAGWIAHLQGRDEEACRLLRRAVKGLPGSPEVHYHLGQTEAVSGHEDLARWHLAAAVAIGEKLRAGKEPIPRASLQAIESAKRALEKLGSSG